MSIVSDWGTLTHLARRSLRQHALSTIVTVLSVALASGLVMSVVAIQTQARDAFQSGTGGFDAVLGARGSAVQLVLNTVFHLETSPGNIPWSDYQQLLGDRRVKAAIPYAVGDHYRGFRIVGTTASVFEAFTNATGAPLMTFGSGRAFDPGRMEAVVGSYVADRTGLRVGDTFHPSHGISGHGHEHEYEYVVVGVTAPTNSPLDRVVWIPLEGVFRMDGHALHGTGEPFIAVAGEAIPDEHKQVSSVLVKLASPAFGEQLSREFNQKRSDTTFVWPIASTMASLFDKIGWVNRVFELVSYLVIIVATAAILASLYNTINERRREFAILRALGARRQTVLASIVLESTTIAFLGTVAGLLVYALIFVIAGWAVRDRTGVVLTIWAWHDTYWLTPTLTVALGALAGLVPALKAYATDVASNLERIS